MKAALPPAAKDKPLEVWFQGLPSRRRGKKPGSARKTHSPVSGPAKASRPRKPQDTRYEWAYVFDAVCQARATGEAIVMPYANTEAMNKHLAVIAACITPGAHGVIVLDGAGWHSSKALAVPPNLTLITQPPFAPEVNPVENVWEYLRKNYLAIRIYETHEDIVDACCQAWKDLIATPNRITSIATRQWTEGL